MRFTYYYKTPDGVRHEGELDSPSYDDVFKELKAKGIRPIKVLSKDRPWIQRGRFGIKTILFLAAGVGLAAGLVAWSVANKAKQDSVKRLAIQSDITEGKSDVFKSLKGKADSVRQQHDAAVKILDEAKIDDWRAISKMPNFDTVYDGITRGQSFVELLRFQAQSLFKDVMTMFTDEQSEDVRAAKRLYGSLMDMIDATDNRIESAAEAVMLLDQHRGHWKWNRKTSAIQFDDKQLQAEFDELVDSADSLTARWQYDFKKSSK